MKPVTLMNAVPRNNIYFSQFQSSPSMENLREAVFTYKVMVKKLQ